MAISEKDIFIQNMKDLFNQCRSYNKACQLLERLKDEYKGHDRLLMAAFKQSKHGMGGMR